jgi:hypothetical protein
MDFNDLHEKASPVQRVGFLFSPSRELNLKIRGNPSDHWLKSLVWGLLNDYSPLAELTSKDVFINLTCEVTHLRDLDS